MTTQATSFHLLETYDHDCIRHAALHHAPRKVQARASGAAVVVDIVDGYSRHAKLVEDTLTAGTIAIAVACNSLVNVVIVDVCVHQGLDTSFVSELCVVDFATRLEELGHANA